MAAVVRGDLGMAAKGSHSRFPAFPSPMHASTTLLLSKAHNARLRRWADMAAWLPRGLRAASQPSPRPCMPACTLCELTCSMSVQVG